MAGLGSQSTCPAAATLAWSFLAQRLPKKVASPTLGTTLRATHHPPRMKNNRPRPRSRFHVRGAQAKPTFGPTAPPPQHEISQRDYVTQPNGPRPFVLRTYLGLPVPIPRTSTRFRHSAQGLRTMAGPARVSYPGYDTQKSFPSPPVELRAKPR